MVGSWDTARVRAVAGMATMRRAPSRRIHPAHHAARPRAARHRTSVDPSRRSRHAAAACGRQARGRPSCAELGFARHALRPAAEAGARGAARRQRRFDVCHPALALRARAVGAGGAGARRAARRDAARATGWRARPGCRVGGVAGTLLWLVTVCALKRPLARRRRAARVRQPCWRWRRGRAAGLAGRCGGPAWPATAGGLRVAGVALAGAALAARLWAWLDLRARHVAPGGRQRAAGRTAVAHPAALPVQRPEHRAGAGARRPGARRGACSKTWRSCSAWRWPTPAPRSRWTRRSTWRSATWRSSRCASATRLQVQLGHRPARRPPRACRRWCCSRWWRTRCATASSRRWTAAASACSAALQRGQVVVLVSNTVPDEPGAPGHGMALHNVRERLRLLHDVAAQCDVWREATSCSAPASCVPL